MRLSFLKYSLECALQVAVFLSALHSHELWAADSERSTIEVPENYELADEYELDESAFYQEGREYQVFKGRVTDRDDSSSILKVQSDDENIKFFKAGDKVRFKVSKKEESTDYCEGNVRTVEDGHFTMFVKTLYPCWNQDEYFRRGLKLKLLSRRLRERIQEASEFRMVLLKRREDFFKQLNDVNHFLWSYKQQKVQLAAEYDRKIEELKKKKRRELESLLSKKNDFIKTQKELIYQLDKLEEKLKFYRIENQAKKDNRWRKDHDLGLPVYRYPEQPKKLNE